MGSQNQGGFEELKDGKQAEIIIAAGEEEQSGLLEGCLGHLEGRVRWFGEGNDEIWFVCRSSCAMSGVGYLGVPGFEHFSATDAGHPLGSINPSQAAPGRRETLPKCAKNI